MKILAKYLSITLQTSTIFKMHIKLIPQKKGNLIIAALLFPSREDLQRGWTFPAILTYVQVPVGLSLTQMTIFSWPLLISECILSILIT